MNTQAFKQFRFWGAVGLIVGFLLPWASLGGFISFNGYQVADMMRQEGNKHIADAEERAADRGPGFSYLNREQSASQEDQRLNDARLEAAMAYLIYLIPIAAACCMILELIGSRPRIVYLLTGLLVLCLLDLFCRKEGVQLLQHLSMGAWITVAAAIAALIGAFIASKPAASVASNAGPEFSPMAMMKEGQISDKQNIGPSA